MEKLWFLWALVSPLEGYQFVTPGPFATKEECTYSVMQNYPAMQALILKEYNIVGPRYIPIYCVNRKLLEEALKKGEIKIERDKE